MGKRGTVAFTCVLSEGSRENQGKQTTILFHLSFYVCKLAPPKDKTFINKLNIIIPIVQCSKEYSDFT